MLINDLNSTKITDKLKDIYNLESMALKYINQYCRKIITNYIRATYKLEPLAYSKDIEKIGVNESLFTHSNGIGQWVVS